MATQREIEYLLLNFDYEGLKAEGFFKNIKRTDYDDQIKRICEWFGILNIFQYDTITMEIYKPFEPDLKTFSKN
jgi:hypothetical protein